MFEVALDSGSTDNVCHKEDAPGYLVEASPGSRACQNFIVGSGAKVANDGQVNLNLEATNDGASVDITSTFQVAKVSRPLMSVGRLCDHDMEVKFKKDKALVLAPDGAVVCTFVRQAGGLCVCEFKLKRPASSFRRQG